MSLSLARLDRAQKHLPPGLPQRIGADLLLTLFVWQQLSARCQLETKAIASQCTGQPAIVTQMLNRIPIPFPLIVCLTLACGHNRIWPVYGIKPDIAIGVVPGEGWLKHARVNWNAVGQSVSFPHFLPKKR